MAEEGITQVDIEMLIAQNALAAEQLRRIIAERRRDELKAEIDTMKSASNGGAETWLSDPSTTSSGVGLGQRPKEEAAPPVETA